MPGPYPFMPSDWVADDAERIGRVKAVYGEPGEVLLDIVLYDHHGDRIGRMSPACGGPRTFEPACSGGDWRRIKEPNFPLVPKWVADGERHTLKISAGPALPPVAWTPKPRKSRYVPRPDDRRFKRALEQIADGHNDARQLAKDTLKRT
jgi:hypothetical protein